MARCSDSTLVFGCICLPYAPGEFYEICVDF
jgi:hypothetical protein